VAIIELIIKDFSLKINAEMTINGFIDKPINEQPKSFDLQATTTINIFKKSVFFDSYEALYA
jgi:hypothetical protein